MKKFVYIYIIALLFLASCDPSDNNEEELITDVEYTLSNSKGEIVIMKFSDKDGDGGQNPVITVQGKLSFGATYTGILKLSNESVVPGEDISAEVKEEDEDHQIFYISNPSMKIEYKDFDSNGKPLGLNTEITPLQKGSHTLKVILRHVPDKNASGVSDGKIDNAGGETDVEVSFVLEVI